MGKAPASQFYWGDLKRDVEYHSMSFEARGIWVEMLTSMWDAKEKGKLKGTLDQLSGVLGCPTDKVWSALGEIYRTKTGNISIFSCNADKTELYQIDNPDVTQMKRFCNSDVTPDLSVTLALSCNDFLLQCNGIVTVINRRMFKEERQKKSSYYRVQKYREKKLKRPCNANVTLPSSSSSSLNNNNRENLIDVTHEENLQKTNLRYYKNEMGNYVCQTCQKSFMQWSNLQDHFEEHEKGIIKNITSSFPDP